MLSSCPSFPLESSVPFEATMSGCLFGELVWVWMLGVVGILFWIADSASVGVEMALEAPEGPRSVAVVLALDEASCVETVWLVLVEAPCGSKVVELALAVAPCVRDVNPV